MDLTVVGSGAAFAAAGCNACVAVDGSLLVDCGAPAHVLLPRSGLRIEDVDQVLLTHFHLDHCAGLPLLIGARAFAAEPRPLRLAGPPGTREHVLRLLRTGYGTELVGTVLDILGLETTVLVDGSVTELGPHRVRAEAVVHSLGPSLAYAVTGPDGVTAAFSGDSAPCAGLERAIAGADVGVVECTGWEAPVAGGHLWRGDVEGLVGRHPRTRFLLTHLTGRGRVQGALCAHDGMTVAVGHGETASAGG